LNRPTNSKSYHLVRKQVADYPALLNLHGHVFDAELVVEFVAQVIEVLVRQARRHHQVDRQGRFGGAQAPDMQVVQNSSCPLSQQAADSRLMHFIALGQQPFRFGAGASVGVHPVVSLE